MSDVRKRVRFGIAAFGVIVTSLASRKYPELFPSFLGKYPGDALWALMVFCIWGFAIPACSTGRLALYALLTSYTDEFTQLYQAPWINAIRGTAIGHLVLGSTFSWSDILSYTVGIGVGAIARRVI
jgi:hypothetical protein